MNVIPNENTNFVFEFSEFELSEFECFGSISHSLITVLLAWTHKKVYINMSSINSRKTEAGKLNKRCLTLDEKTKILHEIKKRKLSCRAITEEFRIGKTQAAKVVKKREEEFEKLREEFENVQGKFFKHIKRENHQKFKPTNTLFILGFKNLRHLVFM